MTNFRLYCSTVLLGMITLVAGPTALADAPPTFKVIDVQLQNLDVANSDEAVGILVDLQLIGPASPKFDLELATSPGANAFFQVDSPFSGPLGSKSIQTASDVYTVPI